MDVSDVGVGEIVWVVGVVWGEIDIGGVGYGVCG